MTVMLKGVSDVDGRTVEVSADSLKGGGDSGGAGAGVVLIKKTIDYTMPELYTIGIYTGYTVAPGDMLLPLTAYFSKVPFDNSPTGTPYVALFLEADVANWITGGKRFAARSVNAPPAPAGSTEWPTTFSQDQLRMNIASRLMLGVYADLGSGNVVTATPTKGELMINATIVPFGL